MQKLAYLFSILSFFPILLCLCVFLLDDHFLALMDIESFLGGFLSGLRTIHSIP